MLRVPAPGTRAAVAAALLAATPFIAGPAAAQAVDTPLPGGTDRVVRVENGAARLIITVTQQNLASTVVGPGGSVVASSNCCYYAVVNPGASIDVSNGADGTTLVTR